MFNTQEMTKMLEPLKPADISIAEIKAMSDDDLLALLNGESDTDGFLCLATQNVITAEIITRNTRKAAKPHWSVIPMFIVAIIAAIASCVAAYPVIFPDTASRASTPPVPPTVQTQNKSTSIASKHIGKASSGNTKNIPLDK